MVYKRKTSETCLQCVIGESRKSCRRGRRYKKQTEKVGGHIVCYLFFLGRIGEILHGKRSRSRRGARQISVGKNGICNCRV